MVRINPFIETLKSKEELFEDFKSFANRKQELGQNALLAHYGLCHGGAIMQFCNGKVESLMDFAGIPRTSIAYFQAGIRAWNNIYNGLTELPEANRSIKNVSNIKLDYPPQQIFYGAPGTGKSHRIKEIIKEHGIDEKEQVIRTTFHPDSDYSTFVGCYKPIMKSVPQTYVVEGNEKPVMADKDKQATKDEIVYDYTPQAFVQAYTKAWTTNKPVILVIEEINRGNCAQIFGDIFQLLDRGDDGVSEYEIKPDKALENYLKEYFATFDDLDEQIKSGKIMKLPANLFIWATMNTSDQSLFPIDSAFKRRWEWKYIKIKDENKNWKIDIEHDVSDTSTGSTTKEKYDWWKFLDKINGIISNMTSSADKQLGYFFCKARKKENDSDTEPTIITQETFVSKVIFYLWNDVFKDYGFEDATLFQYKELIDGKEVTKDLTFPDFYDEEGEKVNEVRLKGFLESVMNWKKTNEEHN